MRLPENETAPIRPPTTASEAGGGGRAKERDCRDPGCRSAPHPVEECNHLGHIGHRNALGRYIAEAAPDHDRDCDQVDVGNIRGKERNERCDQHRAAGPDDPAPSRERVAHPLQPDDEEEDRRNVYGFDGKGEVSHVTPPCRASFRFGRTFGGFVP